MKKIIAVILSLFLCLGVTACTPGGVVTLAQVEITTNPTKLAYKIDEKIDVSGGVITLTYNDKTTKIVDMTDAMISNTVDMTTIGEKVVQISYTENLVKVDTSFKINVLNEQETPVLKYNFNDTTLTIEKVEGAEYSIDDGATYFDENVFNIESGKTYTIACRKKATDTSIASEKISKQIEVFKAETVQAVNNVYTINSVNQLLYIAQTVNDGQGLGGNTIKLGGNINFNFYHFTPIGNKANAFMGSFDGADFTVSNLYFNGKLVDYVGLFGNARANFSNVKIENVEITADESVGALVGSNVGSIENISVNNAVINGTHWVGGVAGYIYGNITNCNVNNIDISLEAGLVDGEKDNGDKAGGIAGFLGEQNYTVSSCKAENVNIRAMRDLGGIVGSSNANNKFINCSSSGQITAFQDEDISVTPYAGGILGRAAGKGVVIENCISSINFTTYDINSTGSLYGGPISNINGFYNDATTSLVSAKLPSPWERNITLSQLQSNKVAIEPWLAMFLTPNVDHNLKEVSFNLEVNAGDIGKTVYVQLYADNIKYPTDAVTGFDGMKTLATVKVDLTATVNQVTLSFPIEQIEKYTAENGAALTIYFYGTNPLENNQAQQNFVDFSLQYLRFS